jgi:serine protease SohB
MEATVEEIAIFGGKAFIILLIVGLILFLIALLISFAAEQKKLRPEIEITNLHEKFYDMALLLKSHILNEEEYKKLSKEVKQKEKASAKKTYTRKVYVIDFNGDIEAKQVKDLREEVTAVLQVATPSDEVVVRLESPGGAVNGYGHAASQLLRVREKGIPLTVCVDEVAASGGYLMAVVANKIIAAPFSIIGSIGVVAQVPNFNRLLKKHDVDYKEYTAGDFKRTVSIFGEITEQGEQKFKQQLESVHRLFQGWIKTHRPIVPLEQVATGEYWLAKEALELKLIDSLSTSDDYLLKEYAQDSAIYKVKHETKKTFMDKLTKASAAAITMAAEKLLNQTFYKKDLNNNLL